MMLIINRKVVSSRSGDRMDAFEMVLTSSMRLGVMPGNLRHFKAVMIRLPQVAVCLQPPLLILIVGSKLSFQRRSSCMKSHSEAPNAIEALTSC